jgi:hypothetical protein
LSAVIALDQLHGYAFVILAPEIGRSLGLSTNGLAGIGLARGLGFVAVGAGVGALVRRGRAKSVTRVGAAVRAGALVVGGVAAPVAAAGAMAAYGGTGASGANAHRRLLASTDREFHRLAGRLGNAAVAVAIGVSAYVLSWSALFVALAFLAAVAALSTARLGSDRFDDEDDTDAAMHQLVAIPGGRVALGALAASALIEFPMYVIVFTHLGVVLHMSVMDRALLIAFAELAGVAANAVLGRRLNGARSRSPHALGVALVGSVTVGFGALVVAMTVTSASAAIVALACGTVATSVTVPLLALGTRAVLADAVPRRVSFVTTAGLAVVLAFGPANDAAILGLLGALPLLAALALAAVGIRSPAELAVAVRDVANVTARERMLPVPGALNEA